MEMPNFICVPYVTPTITIPESTDERLKIARFGHRPERGGRRASRSGLEGSVLKRCRIPTGFLGLWIRSRNRVHVCYGYSPSHAVRVKSTLA